MSERPQHWEGDGLSYPHERTDDMTTIETVARAINKATKAPAYMWQARMDQARAAIEAYEATKGLKQ